MIEDTFLFSRRFRLRYFLLLKREARVFLATTKRLSSSGLFFDKVEAKLSRDGKDDMTMFGFKSHRADISSTSLTGFRTIFATVSGTAGMTNNSFFVTVRTDKEIIIKNKG